MTFTSVIRTLSKSPLTKKLHQKLHNNPQILQLTGISRLPKGLIASALAQIDSNNLLVIAATQAEAGRWAAQLETMGWKSVNFYPNSEASPYEPYDLESEMVWGQMQVLSLLDQTKQTSDEPPTAIVATTTALQPLLPPPKLFHRFCLSLTAGVELDTKQLEAQLTQLGYERVNLVETEGQWSRRGDIVDVFPVSAELPVRLEWFGDELERLREFDPATQRSQASIEQLLLTPTSWSAIVRAELEQQPDLIEPYLSEAEREALLEGTQIEGLMRFLGLACQPACLIDYLPENTIIAVDEPEQCLAHSSKWEEYADSQWQEASQAGTLPKLHCSWDDRLRQISQFKRLHLTELATVAEGNVDNVDLSGRSLPVNPHAWAAIAAYLRGKKELSNGMNLAGYNVWLVSAQPSRTVSLLSEHDCPAQFVPNPQDYPAIEKLHVQHTAVAVKYSGTAELEGFILPTYRIVVVSDREFFGQHSLATASYVRKRRRAVSRTVDLDKLRPNDYVVHKSHGIGRFLQLETFATREYLVIQYADGLLRVPADSVEVLSRYRSDGGKAPQLHKMASKAWKQTKNKVRKSVSKLAVDLLKIYAQRSQSSGYAYPTDNPWQQELEDSFPYQPTPDQLKATTDVKRDLMSDRPMDRLVVGDVGFGKTEVAIRAIFKVITGGNKQVAMLAPTTVLAQQHYHTLKERFAPYPINVGLLNRFRTNTEKKEIISRLATGELDVVVGTHQLLGKEVKYKDLGLLVIDEEQRFGVNQKEKIKALKTKVDVLTLTATPIPRTLYMSLSGIREMSLITTPPPSRRPIKTHLSAYNPDIVRTAIRNELDRGGQVFYVVPRVEGIEEIAAQIREMIPSATIAIAHGQMDAAELEGTMLAFSNGEANILVCTTIVESGLDIPKVNTIIIEDSQKFGLSQLYQLRGRVGRSGVQAHAYLLYPKKHTLSEAARKRLTALREFTQLGSGYQLAMRDMEIRGVGNLLGTEQSGLTTAVGFDLYMEMLSEAIKEVQGQEIPQVEDCQVDLKLTAFIPQNYISDPDQKMDAYRAIATADTMTELELIAAEWGDRFGSLPPSVQTLFQIMQLKLLAKPLGFSRVKPSDNHVILETPMAEPAWKLLAEKLPPHLQTRFVYAPKKVTVRGLGIVKPQQQITSLIEWLKLMQSVPSELETV